VGLVLSALTLAGRPWSDTSDARPPAKPAAEGAAVPKTKVALINFGHVVRNYEKHKTFQKELRTTIARLQAKNDALRLEAEKLSKETVDAETTPERRKHIEKRLKEMTRAMKHDASAFREAINKKQGEQLKVIYKDVQAAAQRYAKDHGIELVLHYTDAVAPDELDSPDNVARKLQAGACLPLYAAPGVDVSKEILAALNDNLRRRKGD
jgi:Skp family chaperone for outer membrane proteins